MHYALKQLITTLPYPVTDLSSQMYVVTGSNTGLGFEAAKHFVRCNAGKVILAVRNVDAGQRAASNIEHATAREGVCEVWKLDMTSYKSVQDFVKKLDKNLDRIDGILLNAGIANSPGQPKAEQDEAVLTVNVVSTMLLACLCVPIARKSATRYQNEPRVTVTSSGTHAWATFPDRDADNIFKALNKRSDGMVERYSVSKLLEIFAVRELAKLANRNDYPNIIVNVVAPGFCKSDLARHHTGLQHIIVSIQKALFTRTTEQGARTLFYAVTGDKETHGKYLDHCDNSEEYLSDFVKSEEGHQTQMKVWQELCDKFEAVQPGIMSAI